MFVYLYATEVKSTGIMRNYSGFQFDSRLIITRIIVAYIGQNLVLLNVKYILAF